MESLVATRYPNLEVEVVVDETPIGCYLEIEGEVAAIHAAAAALGAAPYHLPAPLALPLGKTMIHGERLFALVQEWKRFPANGIYQAHHPRRTQMGKKLMIVLAALCAPLLAPHSPYAQELTARLSPPVWMPGGRQIVFGSWRGGRFSNLYMLDLGTGTVRSSSDR